MNHASASDQISLTFGEAVRRRRAAVGISQRRLSEIVMSTTDVKLYPSAVTRIETGQREPKLTEVVALAEALGVDVGALVQPNRNPLTNLERNQGAITQLTIDARNALAQIAQNYVEVYRSFDEHPELLSRYLFGEKRRSPRDAQAYLDGTAEGIRQNARPLAEIESTRQIYESILAILTETARTAVSFHDAEA